ncbi:unnamed protein product, partial [Scytosiphon promiscuus]
TGTAERERPVFVRRREDKFGGSKKSNMVVAANRWLGFLGAAAIMTCAGVAASSTSTSGGCMPSEYADGFCDAVNNNADCEYDGGDCCSCTCESAEHTCGPDYACVDPEAPCVDDDDI